ncbi:type II toxin-antitoxin system RelE/ParE family toxin [Thiohalobacter sp. IOR34]|uniref:type II toxin-antitoxin system RelE/ParE family toxin n=1 Tax=Thiohalobacter sp. IOR34 TaxID=3057176 RepID=UPI0025AF567E|nr:type II toxin-antitoxin system RelE/ParE family toxin [Thiohalobacter sp. IOR34]WJW76180.1 type II toxin-antitoxin system RelE/ParE family toxin [Thiohalobacter sp. IOR34]
MNIEFHPEASVEFLAAADFYENEVPGLGEGFISEVKRITALIGSHPAICTPIDEVFRRDVLVRFPFSVIYDSENNRLWIIAVANQRRRPGY